MTNEQVSLVGTELPLDLLKKSERAEVIVGAMLRVDYDAKDRPTNHLGVALVFRDVQTKEYLFARWLSASDVEKVIANLRTCASYIDPNKSAS